MVKSWALLALATSVVFSKARAACVDIDMYLDIPSPMTGDVEINLDDVDTIECEEIDEFAEVNANGLETVVVDGGTLTLKSTNTTRFVNVGFKVMSGANLVFDMPKTKFGPNSEGSHRTNYVGHAVRVAEGATTTFVGQVVAKEVANVATLFRNYGFIEFKKNVLFQDGSNVFRWNTGVVKFRGNATFKDNAYLAVSNDDSAYVSFSKEVLFDNNAFDFDGARACSVANYDTSKVIFRGDTTFQNNDCKGLAVYNEADMTFYGKAYFTDTEHNDNGGAIENRNGSMAFNATVQVTNNRAGSYSYGGGIAVNGGDIVFNAPVQFTNNTAGDYGGGIAVNGGDVVFSESVTFDGNSADSGAAFAVFSGSLTFEKPDMVSFRNGEVFDDKFSDDQNCLFGDVAEGATLVGFTGDDVCIPGDPVDA